MGGGGQAHHRLRILLSEWRMYVLGAAGFGGSIGGSQGRVGRTDGRDIDFDGHG